MKSKMMKNTEIVIYVHTEISGAIVVRFRPYRTTTVTISGNPYHLLHRHRPHLAGTSVMVMVLLAAVAALVAISTTEIPVTIIIIRF